MERTLDLNMIKIEEGFIIKRKKDIGYGLTLYFRQINSILSKGEIKTWKNFNHGINVIFGYV
jgi:hypothetical protein